MPLYSGRQVVRLLGRLLTLALVLSLPLLLVLLVLHLVGYLPAPASRPRHAMVQYCDRHTREAHRTCQTRSTTPVADPVAANPMCGCVAGGPRPPAASALRRPARRRRRSKQVQTHALRRGSTHEIADSC